MTKTSSLYFLITFLLLMVVTTFEIKADTAPVAVPPPATVPVLTPVLLTAGSTGADVQIKEDATALNGTFSFQSKAYNPVAVVSLPAGGTSYTIWLRHREGPFQLKGTPGGQQKELQWIWDKPGDFAWTSFGMFNKTDLGDSIVIIVGPGGDDKIGIDAVLIDPTNSFDPTKASKEDLLKLAPAK